MGEGVPGVKVLKILIVSQYFWPENFIVNDIVRKLARQGHEVTVATGKPNYPDGEVFPGYRSAGTQRESFEGLADIVRVPLWTRGRGGRFNLAMNYLSFVANGLLMFPWLLRGRSFDAVFVFAPSPITQAIPAILLKWLKRAPLALWVQDLWPQSLSATGFVKSPLLLGLAGRMVKTIYAGCDLLLVQSRAFVEPVARYASPEKIVYYPNSYDPDGAPASLAVPAALQAELEGHFSVVFAGNLGTAQALDTIVDAANLLRAEPDIRLFLIGSGSQAGQVQARIEELGLENLSMPGRFPGEAMPAIFRKSDALLVTLTDEDIFAMTVPSKVQAYLAAGRPVLAALRGEGARVVRESAAGLVCDSEDAAGLAQIIRQLRDATPEQREAMAAAGRAYFMEHFDMNQQALRLGELLAELRFGRDRSAAEGAL
jgi:glycosyltransferase involved in cell wall biosynthesis